METPPITKEISELAHEIALTKRQRIKAVSKENFMKLRERNMTVLLPKA